MVLDLVEIYIVPKGLRQEEFMARKYLALEGDTELVEQKEDNYLPARFNPLKAYLTELRKYPVLSPDDERKVAFMVYEKKDLRAAERLTVSNLGLVVKIAMSYYNTYLNILDLIQEGNVGLLHAVKKYNPYKGTKFSTYAQFWIRAYILQYIMNSWSLVKIGTTQSQRKLFYRLNKEKRRLESLGLYPAPKVLARSLQVKEEEIVEMEVRLTHNDVRLDSQVNDGGTDTMMDLLPSDEDVERIVMEKESQNVLEDKVKALKISLNEKEICILDNRIMADNPKTLEEIGERFRISRERVRQIEQGVLKKAKAIFNGDIAKLDMWQVCNSAIAVKPSITVGTR
jgi:RNA polymerase sigma-32 factor